MVVCVQAAALVFPSFRLAAEQLSSDKQSVLPECGRGGVLSSLLQSVVVCLHVVKGSAVDSQCDSQASAQHLGQGAQQEVNLPACGRCAGMRSKGKEIPDEATAVHAGWGALVVLLSHLSPHLFPLSLCTPLEQSQRAA